MFRREWESLLEADFSEPGLDGFRQRLRFSVCRDYPWLVSELFRLEGVLGWGPGFREYEGDFFPPPLPGSYATMVEFLEVISKIPRDAVLSSMIREAVCGRSTSRCSSLLATALCARKECRHSVVNKLYAKIAEAHSPYVLGGARLYLFMWLLHRRYALSAAGLTWLLHNPITRIKARAETVRRKWLAQQRDASQVWEAGEPEKAIVQEVCHV